MTIGPTKPTQPALAKRNHTPLSIPPTQLYYYYYRNETRSMLPLAFLPLSCAVYSRVTRAQNGRHVPVTNTIEWIEYRIATVNININGSW